MTPPAAPARVWLVGDVGATNTRLTLWQEGAPSPQSPLVTRTTTAAGLAEALRAAAALGPAPSACALGIAAPVVAGRASLTNLGWSVDERELGAAAGLPGLRLCNDLVAAAHGCLGLSPEHLVTLTLTAPRVGQANLAVLAPGTGLGEARMPWDGARHLVLPSEGGHRDFAPREPLEQALLTFFAARFPGHVSYERVLCGSGLGALYDFFSTSSGADGGELDAVGGDRNAAVARLAAEGRSAAATLAVERFVALLGAEAGNVALSELALGGVFLAGNIAQQLVPSRAPRFLDAFTAKGRYAGMLRGVPVAVVTDPELALRGALRFGVAEASRA